MGKLGKPQRSRKQKKLKAVDPFYKGNRKVVDKKAQFANKKPKPSKDDENYLPASMQEILKRKDLCTRVTKKKRKNKFISKDLCKDFMMEKKEYGAKRPLKPATKFHQRPGESETQFFQRMDRETKAVINMTQFEDKFDVDIQKSESGDFTIQKRKPDDLVEDPDKPVQSHDKKKRKNKEKSEKKKAKKLEKLQDKIDNFEEFQDPVEFGEVAMAPPCLTARPRKAPDNKTNRPGRKDLILKETTSTSTSVKRKPGETIKRKDMSVAQQRIMDKERDRAIELYRNLKKKKSFS